MKIIHQNGYSVEELAMYRLTIYKNLVDCAKALVMALRQFGIEPDTEVNQVRSGAYQSGGGSINLFGFRNMRILSPISRLTPTQTLLWTQGLRKLLYRYGMILAFQK